MKTSNEELMELIEEKAHVKIICEGKRDVESLLAVGFTTIIPLEGSALYQIVERFDKGETVQLLVDLDREGKKLYSKLKADLTQRGVRIDDEFREALFGTGLRQIEGLNNYLNKTDKNFL